MNESTTKAKLILSPQAKAILLKGYERAQKRYEQRNLEQQIDLDDISTQDNHPTNKLAV